MNTTMVALVGQVRRSALLKVATIDGDTTEVEVYGRHEEHAQYNHSGQRNLRPHIGFWAEAGVPLAAELMLGADDPRSNCVEMLDRAIAALPDGVPADPVPRLQLPDRQRRLPFDHDEIVRSAMAWARSRYERRPDASRLLPEPFTLRELRLLHETVVGKQLFKDTVRRRMEPQRVLTDEKSSGVRGPRAAMYRRSS